MTYRTTSGRGCKRVIAFSTTFSYSLRPAHTVLKMSNIAGIAEGVMRTALGASAGGAPSTLGLFAAYFANRGSGASGDSRGTASAAASSGGRVLPTAPPAGASPLRQPRYISNGVLTGLPSDPPPTTDPSIAWRDPIAARAFLVHLLLWVVLCAVVLFRRGAGMHDGPDTGAHAKTAQQHLMPDLWVLFASLAAALTATGASVIVLLLILLRWPKEVMRVVLWGACALQALTGIAMLERFPYAAYPLLFTAFLTGAYAYMVRRRVSFAAAHVSISAAALKDAPLVFASAALVFLSQVLWAFVWVVATTGVSAWLASPPAAPVVPPSHAYNASGSSNDDSGEYDDYSQYTAPSSPGLPEFGSLLLLVSIVSFLWVSATLGNIAAYCASAAVSEWWYGPPQALAATSPLRRACTISLGSLSLSGLIVAVTGGLRAVLARARRRNGGSGYIGWVVESLAAALDAVARWANAWAVCFIAISSMPFKAAGHAAMDLFASRGWESVINDDMVGRVLKITAVAGAVVGAGAGAGTSFAMLANTMQIEDAVSTALVTGALCFILTTAVTAAVTPLVAQATRTVFVLFALAPGALRDRHPAALQELQAAWREAQPAAWELTGFDKFLNDVGRAPGVVTVTALSGSAVYGAGAAGGPAVPGISGGSDVEAATAVGTAMAGSSGTEETQPLIP